MAIGNGPMSAHPSSLLSACPQPPLLCCWAPLCSLSPGLSVQVRASSCPFLSTPPAWPAWPVSLPAGPMHSHTSRPHWAGAPATLLLPAGGCAAESKAAEGREASTCAAFPWLLSPAHLAAQCAPDAPRECFSKMLPCRFKKITSSSKHGTVGKAAAVSHPPLCPTGDLSEQIMKGQ